MRTHGQHGCYVLLDRLQRILTNQVTEPSWRERGAGGCSEAQTGAVTSCLHFQLVHRSFFITPTLHVVLLPIFTTVTRCANPKPACTSNRLPGGQQGRAGRSSRVSILTISSTVKDSQVLSFTGYLTSSWLQMEPRSFGW